MNKITCKMAVLCLIVCSLVFFDGCRFFKGKPIHRAAYEGDLEKVKKIIEKDPSQINIRDVIGFTPLQLASGKGHTEVVKYLLEHGANIELGNDLGEKPLMYAARYGHYETVKILLEHEAKVNCRDTFRRTPLHDAAMYSNEEVINLLISYGADVSAKDKDDNTPLHQAAMLNNIEAAKALVEHGADIFAKNYYDYNKKQADEWEIPPPKDHMNKTPKEIALKAGFKQLAEYLQKKEDEKLK
jgi:cytohesin